MAIKQFEARVKASFWMPSVRAFSGYEFTKAEWRPVPEGFEDQAKAHELLEVREAKDEKVLLKKPAIQDATFPIPDPDGDENEGNEESVDGEENMTPAQKRAARKVAKAAKNKAED